MDSVGQSDMNEFERDDIWQRRIVDKLLKSVLRAHAFEGQVYFIGCQSVAASRKRTAAVRRQEAAK
jgi:hypothetical protein